MFVIVAFGITLLAVSGMTGAVQMATIADVRLEQRIYAEDAAENAITEALARIRSGEVGLLSAITYEDEFNHSTGTVSFDELVSNLVYSGVHWVATSWLVSSFAV